MLRSPFTKIIKPRILYGRFQPNFHQKVATCAGNKSDTSADLENVRKGHHLQKSLKLGVYTADLK